MLIRQLPKDLKNFININDIELNRYLQLKGFNPMYYYDKVFYYINGNEIRQIIEEWSQENIERGGIED